LLNKAIEWKEVELSEVVLKYGCFYTVTAFNVWSYGLA